MVKEVISLPANEYNYFKKKRKKTTHSKLYLPQQMLALAAYDLPPAEVISLVAAVYYWLPKNHQKLRVKKPSLTYQARK